MNMTLKAEEGTETKLQLEAENGKMHNSVVSTSFNHNNFRHPHNVQTLKK